VASPALLNSLAEEIFQVYMYDDGDNDDGDDVDNDG
jgi:hypothetical protein